MINKPKLFCFALAAYLMSGTVWSQTEGAAVESVAGAAGEPSRPSLSTLPEEVVITAERYAYQLREQVYDAQEQMHDIFNKLNDDDRFDMSCKSVTLPNSRISRRLCEPAFYYAATALQGQNYLEEYAAGQNGIPAGSSRPGSAPPALTAIGMQQKELQKKIEELARTNPEYQDAIIKYVELKQRYARTQGRDDAE